MVNRWSAWAQALSSKHQRSAQRAHAASMTLIRQPKPAGDLRILLAMHPIVARETKQVLRSTVREMQSTVLHKVVPAQQHSPALRPVAFRAPLPSPVRFVPVKTVAQLTREVRVERAASQAGGPRVSGAMLRERLLERLVLARGRKEEAARKTLAVQSASAVVGRVRGASTRMEESRPAAMQVVTRKTAESTANTRRAFSMDAPEAPVREAKAPAAAPLDFDSISSRVITEIDRRLVAFRERMGKV
jgi:hypothetical protein